MKIYRAETGKRFRVPKSFESLDDLKAELEQVGRVPISSQILMTSFGLQLKPEMINDVNKAVGKDEYIIFLFDRELLDVNNTNNKESLNEDPLLEPPIIASSVPTRQKRGTWNNINLSDECGVYVNLFQSYNSQGQSFIKAATTHIEFCERLYQEQRMQLMALGVAITNLDSHSRSVIEAHGDFHTFAEKEITKQTKLIQSLSTDIEMLRRITIHPELLKDTRNIINENDSYTLADFVTEDKIIILANEGKQAYDQISKRVQELASSVRFVQSGTETLRKENFDSLFPKMETALSKIKECYNKLKQIGEKLERDVTRVQNQVSKILESNTKTLSTTTTKSIEAFEHLSNIQSQEYLPEMQQYDQYIREKVMFFVQCKNTMTSTLVSSLQEISRLESSIACIPNSLSRLDSEVRSKAQDFKSLAYVHQMPIAYAKTIVEIVRRKEYAKLILTKAQQMAEIMGHFRNIEQKRRDSYRMDAKKYVPVNIPALDDNPPTCDISTANLKDDKLPSFTAEDIHSFLNFIEEIRPAVMSQASFHRSPTFTASSSRIRTQSSHDDPLANLQTTLLKLASQLEGMNYEFDHIIEKSFLSEKNDNDRNGITISRPISQIEGRTLTPQLVRRSKRTSRQSFSEDSVPIDVNMDLYFEKTKQLDKAEEKIKAYEARIKNLETILHTNYQAAKNSSSPAKSDVANSKTEEEITDLRSRFQILESSYTTEIAEKKGQEKKANDLEIRYKNLETSYNAVVNDKETLLKRISELESRHQNFETSHAEVVKEIEGRASNFEARYREMESCYEDAVNMKSSLEKKVDERQKYSETRESSYALVVKEKETLANENLDLQAKFNELKISHDSSTVRCNELEAELEKITLELRNKEPDNFLSEQVEKYNAIVKDLRQKHQDSKSENHKLRDEYEKKLGELETIRHESDRKFIKLEKQFNELREENELIVKEKEVLDAAKSNFELKFADILAEKNKLETGFEEYRQKFEEKGNLYEQDRSVLIKKIEELEAQRLGQEQIEAVEERWRKKVEELQKEKDEKDETIQTYELGKQNLLHEIESWKANLDRMNSAREEYEKQLDKTRERVKLAEQGKAEKAKALEQVEKLIKNITEAILEYMPVVTVAHELCNSTDQTKLETNLNPINMIHKVGSVANSMAQELRCTKQYLKNCKDQIVNLEECLDEKHQMLKERTEVSRVLSKYLWEYYNNIRTLMSAMGLALPLNTENRSLSITSIEEENRNLKSSESRLSDSYYAEDLGKFFSTDSFDEPIEWPKDKYETLLALSTKVNLNEVRDMIRRTPKDAENLANKHRQETKSYREKYRKAHQESKEKIAVRNFKNGDLALFLPTRNSTAKPWAAFNINCPHHFLRATESIISQIRNKDWIVARIVNITEYIVDIKNPNTNPYELPDGVKFYMLDVEVYQNNSIPSHHSRKRSESDKTSSRIMSASLSNLREFNDTNLSMSSSTTDVRSRVPPTRTTSTPVIMTERPMPPSRSSINFTSLFFTSNSSDGAAKENTQPHSDQL